MTSSRITRRSLTAMAVLTLPWLLVCAALYLWGLLGLGPALLALLAGAALTLLAAFPYGSDLSRLAAHARALARGEDRTPPHPHTALAADMLGAVAQLRKSWRAQAEEAEAKVEFQETVFESLPPPLFLLSGQRRIVRANLAARKIFGRELQGRDLAAVLRNPPLLDAAELVLAGEPGREVEFALPGPSDREFRAMLEPLPHEGAEGIAAVLTLHDVTALRLMERMRADFVANASHELRTPLAAVLGFIETLQGPARDDPDARERFLSIMYDQASRMSRLVADLLNLSRIEMNEHTRPVQRIHVEQILRRVVEGLELQAEQRRMELLMILPESLPAVMGQEDELTQVFQNLLDNALKYGREGTPVEITVDVTADLPPPMAAKSGEGIRVAVRDHGDGIAREHLPRLTERFFRVDTARSRRMGGTGLGLAIVKHVINRHRGALSIESELGQGSCFTVLLPVAQRESK